MYFKTTIYLKWETEKCKGWMRSSGFMFRTSLIKIRQSITGPYRVETRRHCES